MTEKRQPAEVSGGFGTASNFGSLDGWTIAEVEAYLESRVDLQKKSISEGGYQRYQFQDGSELFIRPNGEVIRLPHPMYTAQGIRIKGLRISITNGQLLHSAAWHEMSREQQEWVTINDDPN